MEGIGEGGEGWCKMCKDGGWDCAGCGVVWGGDGDDDDDDDEVDVYKGEL